MVLGGAMQQFSHQQNGLPLQVYKSWRKPEARLCRQRGLNDWLVTTAFMQTMGRTCSKLNPDPSQSANWSYCGPDS